LTRAVLNAITSATVKAIGSEVTDIGKNAGNLGKDADKIKKGLGGLFNK
jgi:hypothetical protein